MAILLCAASVATAASAQVVCESERQAAMAFGNNYSGQFELGSEALTAFVRYVANDSFYHPSMGKGGMRVVMQDFPGLATSPQGLRVLAESLGLFVQSNRATGMSGQAARNELTRCLVLAQADWLEHRGEVARANPAPIGAAPVAKPSLPNPAPEAVALASSPYGDKDRAKADLQKRCAAEIRDLSRSASAGKGVANGMLQRLAIDVEPLEPLSQSESDPFNRAYYRLSLCLAQRRLWQLQSTASVSQLPPRRPHSASAGSVDQMAAADSPLPVAAIASESPTKIEKREAEQEEAESKDQVRKINHADKVASQCVTLTPLSISPQGGFQNECYFDVNMIYCTIGAPAGSSARDVDCSRRPYASLSIKQRTNKITATNGATSVNFGACEAPDFPVDAKIVEGVMQFRCY